MHLQSLQLPAWTGQLPFSHAVKVWFYQSERVANGQRLRLGAARIYLTLHGSQLLSLYTAV